MVQELLHFLAEVSVLLPVFLVALSCHEFCHAWVATLCGDDTSRRMGRLTLNPVAHIDPLGLLFLLVFRFGWARPVCFDHRNFKYPRFYTVLTALAGPCANFILALISLYVLKYFPYGSVSPTVVLTVKQITEVMIQINIMLGVFNLLPIPPLDGSHIFAVFAVDYFPGAVRWLYQYGFFILLGLFMVQQTRMMLVQMMVIAEKLLTMLVF